MVLVVLSYFATLQKLGLAPCRRHLSWPKSTRQRSLVANPLKTEADYSSDVTARAIAILGNPIYESRRPEPEFPAPKYGVDCSGTPPNPLRLPILPTPHFPPH